MVYNKKLVAAIKVDGKVLREFDDVVYIKYGSEYSITLKNLNSVKALVNVFIDGEEMVNSLILNPGVTCDLERSIKNNNLTQGNKFKFIERTSDIENYRGIKLEDGLIRIEYQYELVCHNSPNIYVTQPLTYPYGVRDFNYIDQTFCSTSVNNVGITVPGSVSNQQFSTTSSFPLEFTKNIIVLKLMGEIDDNMVVKDSITVNHKPKCITCGKLNKSTARFCNHCGTSLTLF